METKVKDLTVVEFQSLISDTMRATLKDLIEDMSALSSPIYLKSYISRVYWRGEKRL